jgi:glycine dehydrogenase subunit 1
VSVLNDSYFNEFTLLLPTEARPVIHKLAERDILGGVSLGRLYPANADLANGLVVAVTETVTEADISAFAAALKEVLA